MKIDEAIRLLKSSNELLTAQISKVKNQLEQKKFEAYPIEMYNSLENCKKEFEAVNVAIKALEEKAERESPKPLTAEQLKEYANRPVWHKSLQGYLEKWVILERNVAKYPKDYYYGESWIAYKCEPRKEHK